MCTLSLQDTFDLSFGGSLMDEVMKALTVSDDPSSSGTGGGGGGGDPSAPLNGTTLDADTSPLLQRHHQRIGGGGDSSDGTTSFDNIAMTRCDSMASTNGHDVNGASAAGTVTYATLRGSGSSQEILGGSQASSLEAHAQQQQQPTSETLKKKRRSKLRIVSSPPRVASVAPSVDETAPLSSSSCVCVRSNGVAIFQSNNHVLADDLCCFSWRFSILYKGDV